MTYAQILDDDEAASADPEAFLQAALQWHFDPETGSPFWLERVARLDFDPLTDIKSYEDLKAFPNFTNDLRDVRVEDLIPRGYGPNPEVVRIVESGGTSGQPKRVVLLRDWWDRLMRKALRDSEAQGNPSNCNVLGLHPGGPHAAAEMWRTAQAMRGNKMFSIDVDPRWVRKLIEAGRTDEAAAYAEHVIDQAEYHVLTQRIDMLGGSPPMIARLCKREHLVERLRPTLQSIGWGGAHMDADTRYLYQTEIFPGVRVSGGYSTTMSLCAGGTQRADLTLDDPHIVDPFEPWVSFQVVDPETLEQVPFGERGQMIVNHVSKTFFLPNNLERDNATRIKPIRPQVGDSIADVAPVPVFQGVKTITGVY